MAFFSSFTLATLLNTSSLSPPCSRTDYELFARDLNSCHGDRFGADCESRLTKNLLYLPLSLGNPADLLATHDRSQERLRTCSSLWFQAWLCALPPAPADLGGITVGKTLLSRVMKTYAATLSKRPPYRPTFAHSHLRRWAWRPPEPGGGGGGPCGGDEAWLLSDVCAPGGGGGFGSFGRSAMATLAGAPDTPAIRDGELVLRSAVLSSSSSSGGGGGGGGSGGGGGGGDWSKGFSMASLWWGGQLALHSLANVGPCGKRSAMVLPRNHSLPPVIPASSSRSSSVTTAAGPRVAMHIRRGDSCMRWAQARGDSSLRGGRPCFPTAWCKFTVPQSPVPLGMKLWQRSYLRACCGITNRPTDRPTD